MRREMRSKLALSVILSLASVAFAKDPKPLQRGTLVQMEAVPCSGKSAQNLTGEMASTEAPNQPQEPLCQEYLLQSERVNYRIRPRDSKHAALLPVGEAAQFRLEKEQMLLRVTDLDSVEIGGNESAFIVVSMTPRSDSTAADATPTRLNHLQ